MPEIPDRIPGEIIFASYSNDIRDRALMRYVDNTARDASNPVPDSGDLAWIETLQELQIFDGVLWQNYLTAADQGVFDAALSARLDILESHAFSPFEDAIKAIPVGSFTSLGTVVIPTTGDYLVTCGAVFSGDISAGSTSRLDLQLTQTGSVTSTFEQWDMNISNNSNTMFMDFPMSFSVPRINQVLVAGDEIEFEAQGFNANIDLDARLFWVYVQRIANGLMTET